MIDCREAVRRMWSYLDRALEAEPLEEFEAHLDTCTRCCGELEFSRHLREMMATRGAGPPVPPVVRSRVEQLLVTDPDRGPAEPETRI